MNDHSLTNHSIRIRMGGILKAITSGKQFVPETVVAGFRQWIVLSGFTGAEKKLVDKASKEMLMEIERRIRWVKQELNGNVFRNGE